MQEGSNWEAAMAASHFKLGNLVLIIDRNGLQLADRTGNIMDLEPLGDKIRAFGFTLNEVNGNDPDAVAELLDSLDYSGDKPHAVIAETIKGRGVSFIEDNPAWHHRVPRGKKIAMAIEELG